MEFKDRLKELRIEKGCSQQDIGNFLCTTKMCVSHWERGNSEPSISQLIAISEFFGVSVDYLVGKEIKIFHTVNFNRHKIPS